MNTTRFALVAGLLAISTCALSRPASANATFGSNCAVVGFLLPGAYGMVTPGPSSDVDGSTPSTNFSFDPIPASVGGAGCSASSNVTASASLTDESGTQIATFTQNESASVHASASPGTLGVVALANATSTPQSYFFDVNGESEAIDNHQNAFATAFDAVSFFDTFTLVGPSGTEITLQFTVSVDGGTSASGFAGGSLSDTANIGGQIINMSIGSQSVDFTGLAGSSFQINDTLQASAFACAGGGEGISQPAFGLVCHPASPGYFATSSASADAFHTAAVNVIDLTPGTSFSTGSEFNYAPTSAAPESPSLLLLGTGLLGLMGMGLYKKRLA